MFQPRYIVAGTYIYDPYWDLLMMFIYMNTLFASKLTEIWSLHNHVVNNDQALFLKRLNNCKRCCLAHGR